jgi:ankyrin repeat protein
MVMMKKIVIFLSLMIYVSALSMEKPVGSKRGLTELVEAIEQAKIPRAESESESELPSSLAEKLEPVWQDVIALSETGLQDLPHELLARITSLITNAKGNTNDQKLISAAIDINNFARVNKAFREFFKSDYIQLMIIEELAKKYTRGDIYAAAFALATNEASAIIGKIVNDAIEYDEDEATLKEIDPNLLSTFKEYLVDSIKRQKYDAWRFFIKYVDPIKLGFITDSLMINDTPVLVYAIATNNKQMVGKLVAVEGINLNKADEYGRTPLMAAIHAQNTDLIEFLIGQNDVNLNLLDVAEETALFKAIQIGNLEYTNLLLENNVAVNLMNDNGYTPLISAIVNANIPIIRRLLEVPGIDVNSVEDPLNVDEPITSALHHAVQLGNTEIINLLLRVPNIQLNILDRNGQTPLHVAAINQNNAIVDQLIRAGAQVNIQDAQGMTALMYAARQDAPLSLYYLVNAPGVDLTLTDAQGHTALWHARNAQKPGNIVILQIAQAPE